MPKTTTLASMVGLPRDRQRRPGTYSARERSERTRDRSGRLVESPAPSAHGSEFGVARSESRTRWLSQHRGSSYVSRTGWSGLAAPARPAPLPPSRPLSVGQRSAPRCSSPPESVADVARQPPTVVPPSFPTLRRATQGLGSAGGLATRNAEPRIRYHERSESPPGGTGAVRSAHTQPDDTAVVPLTMPAGSDREGLSRTRLTGANSHRVV